MADEPLEPEDPEETPDGGDGGGGNPPPEQHEAVNIEDEVRSSFLAYAMAVVISRALPDVRDGLKPVHRRILYAMQQEGLLSTRGYSKSAGVVGEVLKHYHPHGDSPVYDAMVRMVQDFSLRYPLIDGQGNFGSIDGDPPAAYRYTEARLQRLAEEMLRDIDRETADFVPNFDGRQSEPTVLPTRFPNLLANGSAGIAVGMATNVPPHNLGEVVDAIKMLVADPSVELAELMACVANRSGELAPGVLARGLDLLLELVQVLADLLRELLELLRQVGASSLLLLLGGLLPALLLGGLLASRLLLAGLPLCSLLPCGLLLCGLLPCCHL